MKDLKLLLEYITEHKTAIISTVFGGFVGAVGGVLAYYNGWLG